MPLGGARALFFGRGGGVVNLECCRVRHLLFFLLFFFAKLLALFSRNAVKSIAAATKLLSFDTQIVITQVSVGVHLGAGASGTGPSTLGQLNAHWR